MSTLFTIFAFIFGLGLGLVFFGGLWLAVEDLGRKANAGRFLLSTLLRFAFVLGGFFVLARYGGWEKILAGVAGFILVRIISVLWVRRQPKEDRA